MRKLVKLLYRIYHKYSTFFLFEWFAVIYRNGFIVTNIRAYFRLKSLTKKTKNSKKIKVIFLCQNKQIWGKEKSVFERLEKDKRFSVKILAIPDDIEKKTSQIYDYFTCLYNCVINADLGNKWYNLKGEKPDYVFYQRPYDNYLPKEYQSGIVSGYSKVCYIPYCYMLSKTTEGSCMNKLFFRNVYIYFAENSYYYEKNIKRFPISHKMGYRKTWNLGYPSLEDFIKRKPEEPREQEDKFKILWNPRWTDDESIGGSNFLKYKDFILKYAQETLNTEITFRPHSMLYNYFVNSGKITKKEMDEYYQYYNDNENMYIDLEADFTDTFWNSDVMITDISSVIVEFLMTKKPIIFCNTEVKMTQFSQKLLSICYITNSWQEVTDVLKQLRQGNDYLKERRIQVCKELMGENLDLTTDRIVKVLIKDAIGGN